MDFLALQTKFVKRHLDSRTTWAIAGESNLEAINDGYKEAFNKARQDKTMQGVLKSVKTQITITSGTGVLPSDFLQMVTVYLKSGGVYSELDKDDFPYRLQLTGGVYNIIFDNNPDFAVYIEYIAKLTALVNTTDEPILPDDFDGDIINFALVEYHRSNRDWNEVSNELQYAEGKIGETIDQFWME